MTVLEVDMTLLLFIIVVELYGEYEPILALLFKLALLLITLSPAFRLAETKLFILVLLKLTVLLLDFFGLSLICVADAISKTDREAARS